MLQVLPCADHRGPARSVDNLRAQLSHQSLSPAGSSLPKTSLDDKEQQQRDCELLPFDVSLNHGRPTSSRATAVGALDLVIRPGRTPWRLSPARAANTKAERNDHATLADEGKYAAYESQETMFALSAACKTRPAATIRDQPHDDDVQLLERLYRKRARRLYLDLIQVDANLSSQLTPRVRPLRQEANGSVSMLAYQETRTRLSFDIATSTAQIITRATTGLVYE